MLQLGLPWIMDITFKHMGIWVSEVESHLEFSMCEVAGTKVVYIV